MEEIERLTSEIELLWADQIREQDRGREQGRREAEMCVGQSEPSRDVRFEPSHEANDELVVFSGGRETQDCENVESEAKRDGGTDGTKWENRGGVTREWITTVSQGNKRGNSIHLREIKWEEEENMKGIMPAKTFRALPLPANTCEPHYAHLTATRVT
jgi:hypothetical protein